MQAFKDLNHWLISDLTIVYKSLRCQAPIWSVVGMMTKDCSIQFDQAKIHLAWQ